MPKRIIGLTGGIATGKSTVAQILAAWGWPVGDADVLARAAVAPGSEILSRIRDRYGAAVVSETGELNRKALAAIIFEAPQERQWLEAQIHPYVRSRLDDFRTVHPQAVLVVPLLFEAAMTDLVTEIWVVTSEQQQERLIARDHLTAAAAQARIAAQWPIAEKVARADVVLDNSGSVAALVTQLEQPKLGARLQ